MVYAVAVVAYSQPGAWLCRPPTLHSLPFVYPSVSVYYTVCPKESLSVLSVRSVRRLLFGLPNNVR